MSQEAKLFLQHNSITIFKSYMYFFLFSFFLFFFFSFFVFFFFFYTFNICNFYFIFEFLSFFEFYQDFTLFLQYLQYLYNIYNISTILLIDINCDSGMLKQVAAIVCTEHLVRSSIFKVIRSTFVFWNCNLSVLHQILSGHL